MNDKHAEMIYRARTYRECGHSLAKKNGEDTYYLYKQGSIWYAKNLRTGEYGTAPRCCLDDWTRIEKEWQERESTQHPCPTDERKVTLEDAVLQFLNGQYEWKDGVIAQVNVGKFDNLRAALTAHQQRMAERDAEVEQLRETQRKLARFIVLDQERDETCCLTLGKQERAEYERLESDPAVHAAIKEAGNE